MRIQGLLFGRRRRSRLVRQLVGVGDVPLVEGEVILQEGIAEALHSEEVGVIFCGKRHGELLFKGHFRCGGP